MGKEGRGRRHSQVILPSTTPRILQIRTHMPPHNQMQQPILHELPRRRQVGLIEPVQYGRQSENAPYILQRWEFKRQIRHLALDALVAQCLSPGIRQTHDIRAKRHGEWKSRRVIRAAERLQAVVGGTVGRAGFVREGVLAGQDAGGGRIRAAAKGGVEPGGLPGPVAQHGDGLRGGAVGEVEGGAVGALKHGY